MTSAPYRGLHKFIHELRQLHTKEDERKRINKEMANIRSKFRDSRKLSSYDRRKYVCKLMYMYILDYDVEWGLKEVINLMASTKYVDKQIGYLAAALLFPQNPSLMLTCLSALKTDLMSSDSRVQNLALTLAASFPSSDLNDVLSSQVLSLISDSASSASVKSRAFICVKSLYNHSPEFFSSSELVTLVSNILQSSVMPSLLNSALLMFLDVDVTKVKNSSVFDTIVAESVSTLVQAFNGHFSNSFKYHGISAPWLQVNVLRLLSNIDFSKSSISKTNAARLSKVLSDILNDTDVPKGVSKNCSYAILFEAILFAVKNFKIFPEEADRAVAVIGKFLLSSHPNLKFMGLKACSINCHYYLVKELCKDQHDVLIECTREPDASIRKMAIGVLFDTAENKSIPLVVDEFLTLLIEEITTADGVQITLPDYLKEEIVLRVAILAENYAYELNDQRWYVDTMLTLVINGRTAVIEALWHRIVHFIVEHESIQSYALGKCVDTLAELAGSLVVSVPLLRLLVYVTGEFSTQNNEVLKHFDLLKLYFEQFVDQFDTTTRSIFFSAFAKLAVVDKSQTRSKVVTLFDRFSTHIDPELQQRSVEYRFLLKNLSDDDLFTVFDALPEFPKDVSPLKSLLQRKKPGKAVQDYEKKSPVSQVNTPPETASVDVTPAQKS
ncbi:hypothetical protein GEMRC1_010509 [Eukaryota sp. GEM-RC1]